MTQPTDDIKLPPLPEPFATEYDLDGLTECYGPNQMRGYARAAVLADRERGRHQHLVPGVMRCAKCDFQLIRKSLNLAVGTVTAGNSKTEPCPNGCGPLWPVTWEEYAKQWADTADQVFDEKQKDAQDATRYRWLRPLLTSIFIPGADDSAECCAKFDAHVDAAMAREESQ